MLIKKYNNNVPLKLSNNTVCKVKISSVASSIIVYITFDAFQFHSNKSVCI